MDRADQPAELDLGHQKLDGFVRFFGAGTIVEEEQDARHHLDREEKEGHPAEVVPERVTVDGHLLLPRELLEVREADALVEPGPEAAMPSLGRGHAHAPLLTTI